MMHLVSLHLCRPGLATAAGLLCRLVVPSCSCMHGCVPGLLHVCCIS